MELAFRINPVEARVLGVLIEKAMTTPALYPLTLNALTNGTNQKSNRDPLMTLEEEEVWRAMQTRGEKHLAEPRRDQRKGSTEGRLRRRGQGTHRLGVPRRAERGGRFAPEGDD